MKNRMNQRLEEITVGTLIVGVDVAKAVHWARFVDYRGVEIGKAISFRCNRQGFEKIVSKIRGICNQKVYGQPFEQIVIGMEPTGHYWKTLANYLMEAGYMVVGVNPYHTKKAKELDDNSPTKNDKKDAITIARLIKDGRYFDPYLPQDVYGELRGLSNARVSTMKRSNAVRNTITAILDEYFPEIWTVFKYPLKREASRQILNLFMMFEPLAARRFVRVTETRTRVDFAHCVKELADTHYPYAEKIIMVMDNFYKNSVATLLAFCMAYTKINALQWLSSRLPHVQTDLEWVLFRAFHLCNPVKRK